MSLFLYPGGIFALMLCVARASPPSEAELWPWSETTAEPKLAKAKEGNKCSKLGLLVMSGYAWPTQPGDVDDVRTWCRVADDQVDNYDYECVQPYGDDEFGLVKARIDNLVFGGGPYGIENFNVASAIKKELKDALKILLEDDDVCAITGNVGFMAQLQRDAEIAVNELVKESGNQLQAKPMALGIPAMMTTPYLFPDLYNLHHGETSINEEDRVLLFTSNFGAFEDKKLLCTFLNKITVLDFVEDVMNEENCKKWAEKDSCDLGKKLKDVWSDTYNETFQPGHGWTKVRAKAKEVGGLNQLPTQVLEAYIESIANVYVPVGANNMSGYSGVDLTGGFHSAHAVIETLKNHSDPANIVQLAINATRGHRISGAIMGSTEMPPHSNFLRKEWNMATWDISTLGMCLVRAARGHNFNDDSEILVNTLTNSDFVSCMIGWHEGEKDHKKLEPKFGTQQDGKLKWYDNVPEEELSQLECTGGRGAFKPPLGRLMENFDVGKPRNRMVNPICWTTKVGMCFPPPNGGVCLFPIPGSADCGAPEAACGVWGEKWHSSNVSERTACREAKNVSLLDCYAITKPYVKVADFGQYLCHNGTVEAEQGQCDADATVGYCFANVGCFTGTGGPNRHCQGWKCKCNAGYCSRDGHTCAKQDGSSSLLMASQTAANVNFVGVGMVAAFAGMMLVLLAQAYSGKRSTVRGQPLLA